jgi:hypothetical protein
MKQFILFLFLIFLGFTSTVQSQFITVDDTMSVQELVEDVLISGSCANVSNFDSGTGTVFNGIGYFDGNGSDFPFSEGIVLSTGSASAAIGPNDNGGFGSQNTDAPADPDLDLAVPTTDERQDRTFISFDFVPFVNEISFNFVFASEEYDGGFQCTYTDAFAFLLIDSDDNVQNLAVLPGVAPPNNLVSVTNVHPDVPGSCGPQNQEFFGQYNDGAAAATSPTEFIGQTAVISATGNVIPGETYRMKLVIADDRDGIYDSAVFLEGGSFNLGANLGDDITIEAGTASCNDQTVTLDVSESSSNAIGFAWYQDGVLIPGETDPVYIVTEEGLYTVEVEYNANCIATDDVLIEFAPQPVANDPQDIFICDDGVTPIIYDLTENDDDVLGGQDATMFNISYHETLESAEMDMAPIPNPDMYPPTSNPQTIFVRIEDSASENCFDTAQFEIQSFLVLIGELEDLVDCDVDNNGSVIFDLSVNDDNALDGQDATLLTVTYHASQTDADLDDNPIGPNYMSTTSTETIFVRVEHNLYQDCYESGSFEIQFFQQPEIASQPIDLELCDDGTETGDFNLEENTPIVLGGQDSTQFTITYHELQVDADTGDNPIPNSTTYSNIENPQTIYVRIENNDNVDCYETSTFVLSFFQVSIGALVVAQHFSILQKMTIML